MQYSEVKLDKETIESTFRQIHYYVNLPKHIRFLASELTKIRPNSEMPPAFLAYGNTTVIMGKLNIPLVTQGMSFLNRNISPAQFLTNF